MFYKILLLSIVVSVQLFGGEAKILSSSSEYRDQAIHLKATLSLINEKVDKLSLKRANKFNFREQDVLAVDEFNYADKQLSFEFVDKTASPYGHYMYFVLVNEKNTGKFLSFKGEEAPDYKQFAGENVKTFPSWFPDEQVLELHWSLSNQKDHAYSEKLRPFFTSVRLFCKEVESGKIIELTGNFKDNIEYSHPTKGWQQDLSLLTAKSIPFNPDIRRIRFNPVKMGLVPGKKYIFFSEFLRKDGVTIKQRYLLSEFLLEKPYTYMQVENLQVKLKQSDKGAYYFHVTWDPPKDANLDDIEEYGVMIDRHKEGDLLLQQSPGLLDTEYELSATNWKERSFTIAVMIRHRGNMKWGPQVKQTIQKVPGRDNFKIKFDWVRYDNPSPFGVYYDLTWKIADKDWIKGFRIYDRKGSYSTPKSEWELIADETKIGPKQRSYRVGKVSLFTPGVFRVEVIDKWGRRLAYDSVEIRSESGRDYPGDVVRRRWQHKGWIAEIWDIPVKPDNLEGKIKTDKTKNRTLVISWDFDKRYLELVDHFEVNVSFPEAIKAQLPMQVKADKPFEVVLPLADDFSGRMTFTVEPKHMQKHIINWKSFLKQPFDGSIQEPTEGIINIDLIEEIVVEEKASVEEKALVEVPKAEEERISWSSKQSLAILFLLIGVVLIGWGIFKKGSK